VKTARPQQKPCVPFRHAGWGEDFFNIEKIVTQDPAGEKHPSNVRGLIPRLLETGATPHEQDHRLTPPRYTTLKKAPCASHNSQGDLGKLE